MSMTANAPGHFLVYDRNRCLYLLVVAAVLLFVTWHVNRPDNSTALLGGANRQFLVGVVVVTVLLVPAFAHCSRVVEVHSTGLQLRKLFVFAGRAVDATMIAGFALDAKSFRVGLFKPRYLKIYSGGNEVVRISAHAVNVDRLIERLKLDWEIVEQS